MRGGQDREIKERRKKKRERERQRGVQTFTGGSWDLELVHESPELLSNGHGPYQTLVVEEAVLAPLGTLLVLGAQVAKPQQSEDRLAS